LGGSKNNAQASCIYKLGVGKGEEFNLFSFAFPTEENSEVITGNSFFPISIGNRKIYKVNEFNSYG